MRRRLFDLHLTLGQITGILLLIWSLSGIAMLAEPLVERMAAAPHPKIPPPRVDLAGAAIPPSALPGEVAGVALRGFGGRTWYEVTRPDGRVEGYDARTGEPVEPFLGGAEVAGWVDRSLEGTAWLRSGEPERLAEPDDFYRRGDFPAWRVSLDGPGAPVLYLSARDGSLQKQTDRRERLFRWIGLGVHTWNLQVLKKHADGPRRVLLCLLVGLPLAVMAALSWWLLILRNRATRSRAPRVSRNGAAVEAERQTVA